VRFAFTDDQLLFRDAVADLFAKECPPDVVRAAWGAEADARPELWSTLAEMGVVGLTIPEDKGGFGLTELDLLPILTEAGRVAYPGPLLETTAVAAPLLAEVAPAALADRWVPALASGEAIATVQFAGQPFVPHAQVADLLLAQRDDRIVAVAADRLRLTPQPSVDGARRLFSAEWDVADEELVVDGEAGWAAANRAFDRGALAAAALLIGLGEQLLTTTVDYVGARKQFGVPVGSFQAVKHHLANCELQLTFARPAVMNAAYAMAHGSSTASRDVSMAKCLASDAAAFVAAQALQCHGAIAYTVEYDVHMWLKRVWALAASWGDAAWHRQRVAGALLDG
jgi:alkylation response protein AidB-like acyl-CoA dehydrogenase